MILQVIVHTGKEVSESKEVVERLVNENIENKLSSYIKKFDKDDSEWMIDVKIDKSEWLFSGKIVSNLDGNSYVFEREDYKNLDDLINNLFEKFKEKLSK